MLILSTTCSSTPTRFIQPQEPHICSYRCRKRTRSHGSPLSSGSWCSCPLSRYAPWTRCRGLERSTRYREGTGNKYKLPYSGRHFPGIPLFSLFHHLQFYPIVHASKGTIRRSRYQSIESGSRLHTRRFQKSDRRQSYRHLLLRTGIRQGMV